MSELKDTELNKIVFDWVGTPEEFFCFEDGWKECAARILEKAREKQESMECHDDRGEIDVVSFETLESIIEELTK